MLIGVKKRFIFVANTKTASTSIEDALVPYAEIMCAGTSERKHISLPNAFSEYQFLFGQPNYAMDRFFKFGVMRDPLDWIGSWYRYRKGNQVQSPLPAEMDFEAFWANKDWNIQRGDGAKHLQRDMFIGAKGHLWADVIIPYHKLSELFGEICTLLHVPAPLPRKNVSVLSDTGIIPPALQEEMREFYAADYALWDQLDTINEAGMDKLRGRHQKRA